jgi:hypothetical protein
MDNVQKGNTFITVSSFQTSGLIKQEMSPQTKVLELG